MTGLPSIRRRLSRALLTLVLLWGLVVSVVVWFTVRHEIDELLDDTLRASAAVLAGLLATHADTLIERLPPGAAAPAAAGAGDFAWQLVDPDRGVRLRSARAPETPLVSPPALGISDVARWHVLGVAFGPNGRILYVAQTRAEWRKARIEIARNTALVALLAAAVGLLWLRGRLRRELEPLDALSRTVASFDPLKPGASLGPPTRVEFAPVHSAIDELGRRLARRVASERAFTAHAAHALRTPLAGIDAQLAVALRESPPEAQPRLQRARDAASRLQRVVTALLALFRTGVDLQRQPVDVAELLARLPIDGLAVHVAPAAPVDADPDLLAAALMNLLDNALRYGALHVNVSVAGDRIRLQDDGPGVPEARRRALQAALDRQAYEEHTGLGLMLADLVARAHGGALNLPAVDRGFAAELWLARSI